MVDLDNPAAPRVTATIGAPALQDPRRIAVQFRYAFVADGKNGLRVLQIISPLDDPGHFSGFSPRPTPKLIATARTRGPALAISKGIDRDRAVDESGNQLAVFGRRGARPLNRAETRSLCIHPRTGEPYTVTDEPVTHSLRDLTAHPAP